MTQYSYEITIPLIKKLRNKIKVYIGIKNVKQLSLKYRNITIVLGLIETQSYCMQKHKSGDAHCLRV